MGQVGQRPDPQATQFKVGMQGPLDGQTFEIIGRVVYHDEEDDIWDEWLLLSAAGEYVWISDSDNEGMALWRGFVPSEPVEPAKIAEGMRLNLRNATVTVRDVGRANIDYLEGELTWKAKVNDKMNYAEADGASQRVSIEYTQNEIEFYYGRRLDRVATAKAFGAAASLVRIKAYQQQPSGGSRAWGWIKSLIFVVLALFILSQVCAGNLHLTSGSGSSSSSSSSSFPSSHSSSSSVRSSSHTSSHSSSSGGK